MSLKSKAVAIWKDESAQGATEYILILVAVVTVAFLFKKQLMGFVQGRLGNIETNLNGFQVDP